MITESNYYELFIESVYELAETIVIKSEQTAQAINLDVNRTHPKSVNEFDKRTWKYYRNLAGEYHYTNEPMYVTSLDNQEVILFNKPNLVIHRATARGYQYGSRYYKELVSRYPEQEMLILGILYPIDIDFAIDSRDGLILGYPQHLVEFNEESLIPNMQKWLDGFKTRWYNVQYTCDDLYDLNHLSTMYMLLVPLILCLRLEACKTREAHSYHVKQYLASHNGLDVYIDQMTAKQALWVYRNIVYIEHNTGQIDTFQWLIDNLMTQRSIPLSEFTMRHDIEAQPDELYPTPKFRRLGINSVAAGDETDRISLETILRKEDKLARDNPEYREENYEQIKEDFENSGSNVVRTKALESEMYDYSDSSPYSMEEILLNHWYWLASNGMYQAFVGVDNPKTGERIPMSVKDACVFAFYAMCKSNGLSYDCIPPMVAIRVQRIPTPSAEQIMEVVDPNFVTLEDANFVLSKQPVIEPLISTEAFYNKCREIFEAMDLQRRYVSYQEHQYRRGLMKGMVDQIYSDNICYVAEEGQSYEQWFSDRNIKIEDFSDDELGLIYRSIVSEATGIDLTNTVSVRNLQRAMVNMLTDLSSYSIQVMREINSTSIKMADWAAIRVGDTDTKLDGIIDVPIVGIGVQEMDGQMKLGIDYDVGNIMDTEVFMKPKNQLELEIIVQAQLDDGGFKYDRFLDVAKVTVSYDPTPYQNDLGIVPIPGVDIFAQMTLEEKNKLTDFTGSNCYFPRPTFN